MAARTKSLLEVCVVLVRPSGPVNVGMVARVCGNLGAELRLVRPSCALEDPLAVQYALHAAPLLSAARVAEDLGSAVADCELVIGTCAKRRRRGQLPELEALSLKDELSRRKVRRVALVFGNEQTGLVNDELAACHAYVRLATPGTYDSYNLSHAVAILGFLAVAPTATEPAHRDPPATHADLERLYAHWLSTLEHVGYFRRTTKERFAPKLRAMLGRFSLSRHDVTTLFGMLVQLDRGDAGRKGS